MNKKNLIKHNAVSGFAALIMFAVFAVCIFSVLLAGAGAYKRLTADNRNSFASRTASQYIITKFRQSPSPDIGISSFGDGDCLVFREDIDGRAYFTYVYCFDGWLCELFAEEGGDQYLPEHGEKVIEARSLNMELDGKLLRVDLVDGEGQDIDLCLSIRGGKGTGA